MIDLLALAKYIGALITIASPLIYVSKQISNASKGLERIKQIDKYQDAQIVESLKQRKIITISLLAVMEGLKELGCNNNVSKQHEILKNYLNDQPFKADWYKENEYEK